MCAGDPVGNLAINGIHAIEPAFGLPALWIEPKDKDMAEMSGYTVVSASAVISTHSKVLTSDSKIIGKCAFISDNGRCGSTLSAGGFNPEYEIKKLMTALPDRSHEAWEDCELQGVLVTISDDGNAEKIEVIKEKVAVERPEVSK